MSCALIKVYSLLLWLTHNKLHKRFQHQTESCSWRSRWRRCRWCCPTGICCWSACFDRRVGRCGPKQQIYIGESWGPSHELLSPGRRNQTVCQRSRMKREFQGVWRLCFQRCVHLTYCFCHFLRPFHFIFLFLKISREYILQDFRDSRNWDAFEGSCSTNKTFNNVREAAWMWNRKVHLNGNVCSLDIWTRNNQI